MENEKFFSEKGYKALETRLKSWINLFNKGNFPKKGKMLGFGEFFIETKEECEYRIFELTELLNVKVTKQIDIQMIYGKKTRVEVITYG